MHISVELKKSITLFNHNLVFTGKKKNPLTKFVNNTLKVRRCEILDNMC